MLYAEELFDVEEALMDELQDNITAILCNLNRQDKLEDFLAMIGLEDLLPNKPSFVPYKTGKILVLGQSEVKPDVLLTLGDKLGIDKSRFELCLDYNDCKTYQFKKLRYNLDYSAVIVGPMGHSTKEMGKHGSMIAAMQNEDGYPPIVSPGGNSLKITKSNFKECLNNLKENKLII